MSLITHYQISAETCSQVLVTVSKWRVKCIRAPNRPINIGLDARKNVIPVALSQPYYHCIQPCRIRPSHLHTHLHPYDHTTACHPLAINYSARIPTCMLACPPAINYHINLHTRKSVLCGYLNFSCNPSDLWWSSRSEGCI